MFVSLPLHNPHCGAFKTLIGLDKLPGALCVSSFFRFVQWEYDKPPFLLNRIHRPQHEVTYAACKHVCQHVVMVIVTG